MNVESYERNFIKDIENLKTRMETNEKEILKIIDEQKEQRKLLQESEIKDEKMSNEIQSIKLMLSDLIGRKVRFIDVLIAVGMLAVGAISAYSAIQSNELTKILIHLSEK